MRQITYTYDQLEDLKLKGATYLNVASYGYADKIQGQVISWHKSYNLAVKASNDMCSIVDINDALSDATISTGKPKGFQKKMEGGKRVFAYLDQASIDAAKKIGNGNVSEGIRIALKTLA